MEGKRIQESYTEQVQLVGPGDLNGYNRLFGGRIMEWIDVVAGVVARRHSGCNVTTACVDTLVFQDAAYVGDCIVLTGKMTYVGRTSMEVCVKTFVEGLDGAKQLINTAFLVLVALDADERPTPVPDLILESEADMAEWESAAKRNALRRQRRMENF